MSNRDLLNFPDPRLTIGARIPIPFQTDPDIPYVGESIFGRRKEALTTKSPPPNCKDKPKFCYYCNCFIAHMNKHMNTSKCLAAQKRFLVFPQLTNVRAFREDSHYLMIPDDGEPPSGFPTQGIEMVESFVLMSQLTLRGLPVDFGISDFLLCNPRIPNEFRECCALRSRTGSLLEALLSSVSTNFFLLFYGRCSILFSI